MEPRPSATGDRRDENDPIAGTQRLFPRNELGIDCHPQQVWGEREQMPRAQFLVQLTRRARIRVERLVAAARLLAQQREVLHAHRLRYRTFYTAHDRLPLLAC